MTTLDEQIGIRLKIARKSFGWKTATAFCNAAGIPKSTYSQFEKGHRNFTADALIKYGELFEIEPAWLLTGLCHPCPQSKNNLSRKEFIDSEVKKFQAKNALPFVEQQPVSITDRHVPINMEIFCKVLKPVVELLNTKKILCHADDLITFCLDVYNYVENSDGPASKKENLIHLSINLMLEGSKFSVDREPVVRN